MKRTRYPSKASTALLLILALSLVACGGGALRAAEPSTARPGDPVAGEKIYASACTACHGLKGDGIRGLSGDMTQSELIASKTDPDLVEFLKVGGEPDEPRLMLPKGGVPSLTDQNLADVVAYLRTLQKE
jgi:mono/diheme cytochrome c family protein